MENVDFKYKSESCDISLNKSGNSLNDRVGSYFASLTWSCGFSTLYLRDLVTELLISIVVAK